MKLLEHFDRVSEAPGAVPRLRRFILDLAVRGRLVEQDPNDEPAGELLKRSQGTRLSRGRKHEEAALSGHGTAVSFGLPRNWCLAMLGDVLKEDSRNGYSRKPDDAKDGVPILRISAGTLRSDWIVAEEAHKLIGGVSASDYDLYALQPGDLLACRFNGTRSFVARLALYTGYSRIKPIYPDKLIRLRLVPEVALPTLVRYFAQSEIVRTEIETYCSTTVGNWGISASNLKRIRIPIPPLGEQRRLVAKVDELMALCDRLEAAQAERERRRDRVVVASLERLNDPAAPAAFRGDVCFHLRCLPHVAVRSEHFTKLRRTIVSIAVRGRLVPQDPNEEPASILHERLRASLAKTQYRKATRRRRPVSSGASQFFRDGTFPGSWALTTFDQLNLIVSGVAKGKDLRGLRTATYPYLRVANVQQGYLDLRVIKEIEIPAADFAKYRLERGDVLMTEGGDWDKLGRAAVWNCEVPDCIHQNHIYRIRPAGREHVLPDWIALFANSSLGRSYFERASKQTTNLASINMTQLRSCPLPIPPIAEQHRILAKVAELMAVCDRLEAQLKTVDETSRRTLVAVLRDALADAGSPGAIVEQDALA